MGIVLGAFFAWSIVMDVRPLEWQADRIEAADLAVRTQKIVAAPPSAPENEPVPLLAVPQAPGMVNLARPSPATNPSTLWTVVTLLPEDSGGDVFHVVVSVPVTVVGPTRLMQPSSAPWVSERVPDTVPFLTVNPAVLLMQSLSLAVIIATVVPAGSLEVSVGLNVAEPLTSLQVTVSLVAFILGVPAPALPPVAAMRPSGVAIAAPINNSLRIMCEVLLLFSRAKLTGFS